MIPKGKRRQSVRAAYREHRDVVREQAAAQTSESVPLPYAVPLPVSSPPLGTAPAPVEVPSPFSAEESPLADARSFVAGASAGGKRLDAYLSKRLPEISRSRIQLLIVAGQVTVDGSSPPASFQLKGGEQIAILGEPQPPPLQGEPENIPLAIVYEDDDLAVINKPAGMMVHAGSGNAEHNRGTLVNALLFHFGKTLSVLGGELRPGIVHRLDKDTSGLILVAKNDRAHKHLGEQFSSRTLRKTYIALLQGATAQGGGTVDLPISRDLVRRTRMTTRRADGRHAITHWRVLERLNGAFGPFTLVELHIETGRTHQIRVHMRSLGHPVVGDTVYGAPEFLRATMAKSTLPPEVLHLDRNFLHAAELEMQHPASGKPLHLTAPLPPELQDVLTRLRQAASSTQLS